MDQSLSEGITIKTQTELTDFIFVVIKLPCKKLPRQTVKKIDTSEHFGHQQAIHNWHNG